MKIHHIKRLVNAKDSHGNWLFPQLEPLRGDAAKQSLNPKHEALLVGAYLQDVTIRLELGQDPIPSYTGEHKAEVREKIQLLWKSQDQEKRMDALIRSYNPGDGQTHVDNVRRHLKIIEESVGKLFM